MSGESWGGGAGQEDGKERAKLSPLHHQIIPLPFISSRCGGNTAPTGQFSGASLHCKAHFFNLLRKRILKNSKFLKSVNFFTSRSRLEANQPNEAFLQSAAIMGPGWNPKTSISAVAPALWVPISFSLVTQVEGTQSKPNQGSGMQKKHIRVRPEIIN